MSDNGLTEYTVDIDGIPHTLQLDEAAAKAYGDRAKKVGAKAEPTLETKAQEPANKSRTTKDK